MEVHSCPFQLVNALAEYCLEIEWFKSCKYRYGGLVFGLSLHLLPYFEYSNSEGSAGQSLQIHWHV